MHYFSLHPATPKYTTSLVSYRHLAIIAETQFYAESQQKLVAMATSKQAIVIPPNAVKVGLIAVEIIGLTEIV